MPSVRIVLAFAASLATASSPSVMATAAPLSTQFVLDGAVVTPGTYDLATLSAFQPPTTQTVTYTAAGTPVTDTYTGTTLQTLVNAAGGFTPQPGVKNSTLRNYIVAVGSDGYQAVFAAGEFNPNFGNRSYMAAYADTGGQLGPGGPSGFARMVVPGDVAGGRYVSNLVQLHAGTAPSLPGTGGGVSSQFTLSGVVHPATYTLASLSSLPATTLTATYTAMGTPVTDTYTGVSLWTLLSTAGLITDPTIKNDVLRQYVVAVGSDGYEAVFSLGEIDPMFGNQPDLVAYADTGGQLGPGGPDGFARMVVPGDLAGGRYVSNLVALAVFDATVPEPTSLLLLITSLLGTAVVHRRHRMRKASSRAR
jgi:DMSO/TMAO reductase YedYZ molybdopterin-dependent catalytic subunit